MATDREVLEQGTERALDGAEAWLRERGIDIDIDFEDIEDLAPEEAMLAATEAAGGYVAATTAVTQVAGALGIAGAGLSAAVPAVGVVFAAAIFLRSLGVFEKFKCAGSWRRRDREYKQLRDRLESLVLHPDVSNPERTARLLHMRIVEAIPILLDTMRRGIGDPGGAYRKRGWVRIAQRSDLDPGAEGYGLSWVRAQGSDNGPRDQLRGYDYVMRNDSCGKDKFIREAKNLVKNWLEQVEQIDGFMNRVNAVVLVIGQALGVDAARELRDALTRGVMFQLAPIAPKRSYLAFDRAELPPSESNNMVPVAFGIGALALAYALAGGG